jgi:hypothetical protein
MIDSVPEYFKKRFELGVSCYLKGRWGDSRLQYYFFNSAYARL